MIIRLSEALRWLCDLLALKAVSDFQRKRNLCAWLLERQVFTGYR